MSIAEDLRKQTHQTIETSRPTRSETPVPTAGRQGSASQPQPREPLVVNQDSASGRPPAVEPESEITEVDDMTRLLTPEEQTALEDKKKKEAEKRKKLYGEIQDKFNDPDEGDYEKSKFDIQQGDLIEFLMKDVVLESFKWTGDKVCGCVGLYTYRLSSWIYHGIADPIKEECGLMMDEYAKKRAEAKKDTAKSKADDFAPDPKDDKTTKFAKEVYALHQKQLEHNPIAEDAAAYTAAIHAAIDGRLDEIKLNDKTGQPLPDNHRLMQHLRELSRKAQTWPDKEAAKTGFAHLLVEQIATYDRIQTISSNYAVAKMIQEKSKDPQKFDGQNLETNYKEYVNQGYKAVLLETSYILGGTSDYKDLNDLLKTSLLAVNEAKSNIKNHNYIDENDKGRQPQTPQLQKLDNILESASTSARAQTEEQLLEQTLPEYSALCLQRDSELNRRYQQVVNNSENADSEADEYAHRRERQRGTQPKPQPEKPRGPTPTFTQGDHSR